MINLDKKPSEAYFSNDFRGALGGRDFHAGEPLPLSGELEHFSVRRFYKK